VHFDPVPSEHPSAPQHPKLVDAIIPSDLDAELEAPRREGLPPAFRMRHARHYVEEVMGDAPIRTVREIALQELDEAADGEMTDLQALESSIRAVGVVEPLLVWQRGRRFQVIAGTKRLRAARAAGLRTVPCLVQDVDDEMAARMRDAVRVKSTPVDAAGSDGAAAAAADTVAVALAAEGDLDFVAALAPALQAAGPDPLRRAVLGDLAASELSRARSVAACAGVSLAGAAFAVDAVSIGDLLQTAVAAILPEARLRGVRLEVSGPAAEYRLSADGALVSAAAVALMHGALALAPGAGSALRVSMQGTVVRPAMILEAWVGGAEIDSATARRLFDADSKPHPCGPSGGLLMSTVRNVARLHGGRADADAAGIGGCRLVFVVPRRLER
jgi:signal transduction histidine kinase